MKRRMSLLACVVALAVGAGALGYCVAQDDKKDQKDDPAAAAKEKPAADSPAGKYAAARATWDDLLKQLKDLAAKFRTAPEKEREDIKKQYNELAAKATAHIPKLREASLEAYKAAPNADKDVIDVLIEMAAEDLGSDQSEDALALAKVLIDNKCPNAAVYKLAGIAAYALDQFDVAEKHLQKAQEEGVLEEDGERYLQDLPIAKKAFAAEQAVRAKEAKANDLPRVQFKTSKGDVVIELYENEAPQTVGNFVNLVEKGFYKDLTFHRVLPNFMAQGGDPDGTGGGGPGYNIFCECQKPDHRNHFRGTLSMAHAGKDTGGSQFFLTFRRTPHLDGAHTVFGRVVEGLDVLAKLQRRDPSSRRALPEPDKILEAKVIRKRDHEYKPTIASEDK